MNKISYIIFLLVCIPLLFSCETESEEWKDVGYTSIDAKVVYQQDPSNTYRVYFSGIEISNQETAATKATIYRSDLTGILQVYNTAKDSILELEQEITLVPGQTINLIQLGDDPVQIVEGEDNEDVELLENPNGTMLRFYYSSGEYESLTLRLYAFCLDDNTAYTYLGDVKVESGVFSDYFKFDVALFSRENGGTTASKYRAYTAYDIYFGDDLLFEHTYRNRINVFEGGRSSNEYGSTCKDMLQTFALSLEDYEMTYLFGTTWEELGGE